VICATGNPGWSNPHQATGRATLVNNLIVDISASNFPRQWRGKPAHGIGPQPIFGDTALQHPLTFSCEPAKGLQKRRIQAPFALTRSGRLVDRRQEVSGRRDNNGAISRPSRSTGQYIAALLRSGNDLFIFQEFSQL